MNASRNYSFTKVERKHDYADFNCTFWDHGIVKSHTHEDYYEIVFSVGEPMIHIVGGERTLLRSKSIVVIPPGPEHAILPISPGMARHFNLAINASYFKNFIRNKKRMCSVLEQQKPIYLQLDEPTYAFLLATFERIDNNRYDEVFAAQIESILFAVAAFYLNEQRSSIQSIMTGSVTDYCKDVIFKIDNYSYISQNMTDIYRHYPISHTSFSVEFKRLTGQSPTQYLTEKKLEYSKKMILTSDLSILDISNSLGYESTSHFIRIFHKEYGMTPLQYRKKHHIEEQKNNS